MTPPIDRRTLLIGGAAAALLGACTSDGSDGPGSGPTTPGTPSSTTSPGETTTTGPGGTTTSFTAADFEDVGACELTPQQMAGPYPLDEPFDRRDITEGHEGHPLRLGIRVLDEACSPIAGAAVEIWHCDATGDYSAYSDGGGGKDEAEGTTFLRGTQTAGDDGIVEFATIYPGWYRGRAVHIHVRVHLGNDLALTSQVYFAEDYTEEVYGAEPYAEFGAPDTGWAQDAIAGDPGVDGTALRLRREGDGTTGLINLTVSV